MCSAPSKTAIAPFADADHAAVVDLVTTIQQLEFKIPIAYADQPDLHDIPAFYRRQNRGEFWVARAGGRVVGTIALIDIGNGQGALRKMFVARDWRDAARAVAADLLGTLEADALRRGLAELLLGTTAQFTAAHRFYGKNGFVEIAPDRLPAAFPRMAVDTMFFRKQGLGPGLHSFSANVRSTS